MAYHIDISYAPALGKVYCRNNLPHDGVPTYSERIPDQCYGIYRPEARIGNKYAVADYDDEKKRKWI